LSSDIRVLNAIVKVIMEIYNEEKRDIGESIEKPLQKLSKKTIF